MLTPRQRDLLDFITAYIAEHRYGPSYEEMMASLNVKSRNSVTGLLNRLVERGYIRRTPRSARAIEVKRISKDGHEELIARARDRDNPERLCREIVEDLASRLEGAVAMTEQWWVVQAPDGRLLSWSFAREPDVAKTLAEESSIKWPAMEADGYRVVQVEVRRT